MVDNLNELKQNLISDWGFLKIDTNGNLRFTLQYLEIDKTVWNRYVFSDYLKRGYFLWQKATHS